MDYKHRPEINPEITSWKYRQKKIWTEVLCGATLSTIEIEIWELPIVFIVGTLLDDLRLKERVKISICEVYNIVCCGDKCRFVSRKEHVQMFKADSACLLVLPFDVRWKHFFFFKCEQYEFACGSNKNCLYYFLIMLCSVQWYSLENRSSETSQSVMWHA